MMFACTPEVKPVLIAARESALIAFQYRFCVDCYINNIANDDPTSIKRAVPAHSKIAAVDPCLRQKSHTCLRTFVRSVLPPRRLPLAEASDVQFNFASHATNRQLASKRVVALSQDFYLIALECYVGVILD